jgi:Uma2 family endonuclease
MLAASGSASAASGRALPPDERIAEPETRYEIIDGQRAYVSPADEPHATEHLTLGYLLAAHVTRGYRGALDMLTRTSETSDYAPDASVFAADRDPVTGGRCLEELAFEIASTQSRASATRKARGLAERGVRRVFCVDIKRREVLEWDPAGDSWRPLAANGAIEDRCFIRPLSVAALLSAAGSDDEVARALHAKDNPVLADIRAEGRAEGHARGRAESVIAVLEARGLEVPADLRARILACTDLGRLDRWLVRAMTAAAAEDIDDPE